MGTELRRIAIIARRTLVEIVRARVLYALAVFVLLLCWASVFVGGLTFESTSEVAIDLGLTGVFLFMALSAVMIGLTYVGDAAGEVFAPLVAGGLRRPTLFLGRWLGSAVAVLMLTILPTLLLLVAVRGFLRPEPGGMLALRAALVLYPLEAILLHTLAGALAVIFRRPVALSFSFGIWVACHLHPDVLAFEILYPGLPGKALRLVGSLAPDLEFYNPLLFAGFDAASLAAPLGQAIIYTLLVLLGGALYFRRRDL